MHAFLQDLPALRLGQVDWQVLNSAAMSCLQSFLHLARAGEPTRPVPNIRTAVARTLMVAQRFQLSAQLIHAPSRALQDPRTPTSEASRKKGVTAQPAPARGARRHGDPMGLSPASTCPDPSGSGMVMRARPF